MFISIGDAKVFASSYGSKASPAILGIGGWIGSWELWSEPFSILSQDWRTITYDHRGAGATTAPLETITFEQLVDDVFTVLDAFDVEHSILAAESAGALTALGAALKNPQRITGLVIVDGLYFRKTTQENDPFLYGLRNNYPATLDFFVEACVPEPDSEHIKRWGRQIINRASQDAAIALHLLTGEIDLRDELHRVTQPTLIIHGEADDIVPIDDARWLANKLPNSKLVSIKGAGHVPTMTCPTDVTREIYNYFRG